MVRCEVYNASEMTEMASFSLGTLIYPRAKEADLAAEGGAYELQMIGNPSKGAVPQTEGAAGTPMRNAS